MELLRWQVRYTIHVRLAGYYIVGSSLRMLFKVCLHDRLSWTVSETILAALVSRQISIEFLASKVRVIWDVRKRKNDLFGVA